MLKLIEFAFGSPSLKQKNFIPEIHECEKVVLEVLLDDQIYTFERRFRPSRQIEVYRGTIDEVPRPMSSYFLAGQDISEFILDTLAIPSVAVVDEISGRERSIVFDNILSLIYLDQELGFSRIHARLNKTQSRSIFKLVSGISVPEMYELTIEQESLRKRRTKIQTDLEAIELFLSETKLLSSAEINEQRSILSIKKEQKNSELIQIRDQVRARPNYADPIRDEILALEENLSNSRQEVYFSAQTLNVYEQLENQLLEDIDKSERVISSNSVLLSFEFEQCPRCLQPVTEDMKERELVGHCNLCDRTLSIDDNVIDNLEQYRTNTNSQLAELSDIITRYRSTIGSLKSSINQLEEEVVVKRNDFDRTIAEYVSPVIRNIEVLSKEIANIDAQLSGFSQQELWIDRIESMCVEIREIGNTLHELRKRQRELREEEKAAAVRLGRFTSFLREFLKNTYPEPIDTVKLNPTTYMPEINGYAYDSRSATQKNIAIIGYFYAQLRFSIEESTYIPKFLIVDTLRQDDLERETYEKILDKFKNLEDRYGKTFQLIIVIRDAVDALVQNEILQLVHGNHLLIV